MGLDIRLPIGMMFCTFSPILLATGYIEGTQLNSYSGAAMGAFGLVMLGLAYMGRRASAAGAARAPAGAAAAGAAPVRRGH